MKKTIFTIKTGILGAMFVLLGFTASAQIIVVENITAGTFPGEVGWEVVNAATNAVVRCVSPGTGQVPGTFNLNLAAGTYNVLGYDSFGDGWNGAQVTYTQGGVNIGGPFQLATGGFSNFCPGPSGGPFIGSFVVAQACVLSCPPNITVNNSPGLCGANVTTRSTKETAVPSREPEPALRQLLPARHHLYHGNFGFERAARSLLQ
jgi:hypothetical protein